MIRMEVELYWANTSPRETRVLDAPSEMEEAFEATTLLDLRLVAPSAR